MDRRERVISSLDGDHTCPSPVPLIGMAMEAGCGPSTSGREFAGLFFRSIVHLGELCPHVAPRMYIELRICSFLTKLTNNDASLPGPRLGPLVYRRALGGVVRARFVLNSVGVRRG